MGRELAACALVQGACFRVARVRTEVDCITAVNLILMIATRWDWNLLQVLIQDLLMSDLQILVLRLPV